MGFRSCSLFCLLAIMPVFAPSEPADDAGGPDDAEYRTWSDVTGKYTTEAVLLRYEGGKVHLRKRDGTVSQVSMVQLSKADQKFVRDELARKRAAKKETKKEDKPAASSAPAGSAGEWPSWRGALRDGKSLDTGLLKEWPEGGPPLLWSVDTLGAGFATVAVANGNVYTCGDVGSNLVIFAFDMDGKLKWQVPHGPAYRESYPGSRGTPTIDGGDLYVLSGMGLLGCFDARTGQGKWTRRMDEFGGSLPGWGYAESVLILNDLAIVTPGGANCIMALDKRTGQPRWSSRGFQAGAQYGSCYSFEYQGVPMIVTGTDQGIVCVHAEDGRLLWSHPFSAQNTANCPTPAFSDGYVFWANGYGKGGICLKLEVQRGQVSATEAWMTNEMDCHHGGYIIHEGHIYGNHDSTWVCLDLRTGERKWRERAVGKGSVCYADGMLYLFSEDGGRAALATCSPDGLQVRGELAVQGQEKSWAHPVVVGGRLYLRYHNNLYCFDVRAK